MRLEFDRFAVWSCGNCGCDHVKITDGDGTILMDKSCGDSSSSPSASGYFQLPVIVTNTNTVEIFFHTDARNTKSGWSFSWTAVTPGVKTSLQQFTALALSNAFFGSFCLTDNIFYQSAALPPPAAPAQTWKPKTANTRNLLLANPAAAASAQMQLGSALLVSPTRPLEPDSGRCHRFAPETAVAARVSNVEKIVENVPFVEFNLKDCLQQVLSPLQTTPTVILTTWRRQRRYG